MKFFNLFRLHQTDNIKTKNINKKRADTKKISKKKRSNGYCFYRLGVTF